MIEEIRQTDVLTDEEEQRLFGWGENIFGTEAHKLTWRPKDLHFILYLEGEPVSHTSILKHVISLDGQPITVAGVGGVVTVPEAQRKGFARKLVQHASRFFEHEWQVDAGLLFCRTALKPYYEALGWKEVPGPVLIEQPDGKVLSPMHVMVLPLDGTGVLSGTIDLKSLPW